jgi:hypothetical protein
MRIFRYAILSLAMFAFAGCVDKKCQPGDSAKTCEVLTQCFQRGEKTAACRQLEADQQEYERNFQKNIAPAYTGAGSALSYDPNKATQKPPAKTQPQQQPKKQ